MLFFVSLAVAVIVSAAGAVAGIIPDRWMVPVAVATFVATSWVFHGSAPREGEDVR